MQQIVLLADRERENPLHAHGRRQRNQFVDGQVGLLAHTRLRSEFGRLDIGWLNVGRLNIGICQCCGGIGERRGRSIRGLHAIVRRWSRGRHWCRLRLLVFLLILQLDAIDGCDVNGVPVDIVRHRQLPIDYRLRDGIRRKGRHHLAGAHGQRAIRSKVRLQGGVIDSVGMQLEVDPLVDAHRGHGLDIARTRTEAKPVERVQRTLLLVVGFRGLLLLGVSAGCDQNQQQSGKAKSATIHENVLPARSVV